MRKGPDLPGFAPSLQKGGSTFQVWVRGAVFVHADPLSQETGLTVHCPLSITGSTAGLLQRKGEVAAAARKPA